MFKKLAPDTPISDEDLYSVLSPNTSGQTIAFMRICHSSYLPGALRSGEVLVLRNERITEKKPFTLELLSVLKGSGLPNFRAPSCQSQYIFVLFLLKFISYIRKLQTGFR